MPIRQLTETIINQIAAGEVIERPASVVKELVENALDAGARKISVVTAGGGLALIRVTDDGSGIQDSELVMAVSRHCTSKLSDDLLDIRSLGFRGEALPSVGSVSRMTIRSRTADGESAMEVTLDGGRLTGPRPCAAAIGTEVEVRELFFNTPARLKFMKGERAENSAIADVVRRIAIAFPTVRFELSSADRQPLILAASANPALPSQRRVSDVVSAEFTENAIVIDAVREGVRLKGLVGLPSYNRAAATHQFAYVNGRPVRDRQVAAAIRAAYSDAMPRDRHAVATLFLELEPGQVDVNVHPAKADVRFRDPGLVRGLIIGSIRQALADAGIRPATTGASAMMDAFSRPSSTGYHGYSGRQSPPYDINRSAFRPDGFGETAQAGFEAMSLPSGSIVETNGAHLSHPLGAARAQIASTYIVAETSDSLVLIDQHAAHERLVYEELKAALHGKPLNAQLLLIPEIIDLSEDAAEVLAEQADLFSRFGLQLERIGPGAVAVRATPAILGQPDVTALVRDLADELARDDTAHGLKARIDHIAATIACHGSVRAGRALKGEEMNALLRQMESTPGSGTCNHGRPTFIELKLSDIERLFGRR